VCPHGVAKSVIARAYFQQSADQRGMQVTSIAAGIEPEDTVWPTVVDLLRLDGIDVSEHHPQQVTQQDFNTANRVIALGCDLDGFDLRSVSVEYWNDIPLASQDLPGARAVILTHLGQLVEEESRLQDQGEG
jgi:protein-tyrosine-phosphatase